MSVQISINTLRIKVNRDVLEAHLQGEKSLYPETLASTLDTLDRRGGWAYREEGLGLESNLQWKTGVQADCGASKETQLGLSYRGWEQGTWDRKLPPAGN